MAIPIQPLPTAPFAVTGAVRIPQAAVAPRLALGAKAMGRAVLVLRWKWPDLPRPYRPPGYPVVPRVIVAVSLALMISALVQHPISTAAGLGLTLLGISVYLAWGREPRGETVTELSSAGA